MIVSVIGFIVIALILCVTVVFGMLGVGQIALSGPEAIERDGLARGQPGPAWVLADADEVVARSPPAGSLQLVLFADHCLTAFPSVVAGVRDLRAADEVEIVILTRGPAPSSLPQLRQLGLDGIPVVTAGPAIYARYNVRVMPFAMFVDSAGLVRASSLVNHDWQLAKLRQIAAIPIEALEPVAPARLPLGSAM